MNDTYSDNEVQYKDHVIVPVRYGQNGQYNWTTKINGKPFYNQGPLPHTRAEAIARAKQAIDDKLI